MSAAADALAAAAFVAAWLALDAAGQFIGALL